MPVNEKVTLHHIHLVSDATGETINSIARAAVAQFENVHVKEHHWSLIRSKRQLDMVMDGIRQWPGLVLYTFVDEDLRRGLEDYCRDQNLASIPVLAPVLKVMATFFGVPSAQAPGRQHALDALYFARIDAMDFAIAMDDGHGVDELEQADVIILGVSRTSKTPTCLYLAGRGVKAANIPFVPGHPPPFDLANLKNPLIVGLTKEPDSLVEIRRQRLHLLQPDTKTSYADPEHVRSEVLEARRFFAKLGCSVIDVTRRSIEETAAEIMMLLEKRDLDREAAQQAPA